MATRTALRSWKRAAQVAVSVGILGAFVLTTDWHQARELLLRANPWALAGMAVLFPLDRLFMAWKWHLLARVHPGSVGLWSGTRIYLASSAVGLFLPLGGVGPDIVRGAMLTGHGTRPEAAVSSILVERLCGICGAGLMLASALVLLLVLLPEHMIGQWTVLSALLAAVGGAILLAGVCYGLTRLPPARRLWRKLLARPAASKYVNSVLTYSRHRRLLAISVLLAWIEQLAPILAFYLAFRGFGVPLTLVECAAIIPIASILERLPISVAGIGVRELGIVVAAGLFGVSRSDAFLVSIFEHIVFILTMVPLGLLYFASRGRQPGTPQHA